MVLFKRIEEFPDYFISMDGQVYNDKKGFYPRQHLKDGYLRVNLFKGKTNYSRKIHRLLAAAFIENPTEHRVIDHINQDRTDNRLKNLRWCSPRQNCQNKTNTSHIGYNIYLRKDGRPKPYVVGVQINGKLQRTSFKTLLEAIEYRDNILNNL